MRWKEIAMARGMLNRGEPMAAVIAALGNRFSEAQIHAGIRDVREKKRVHNAYSGVQCSPKQLGLDMKAVNIPVEVLEDRDRRLSIVPDGLTSLICNDPPRGLSALATKLREHEQKEKAEAEFRKKLRAHRASRGRGLAIFLLPPPPIVHDRFDDLSFRAAMRKRYSDKYSPAPPPRVQLQESSP